MLDDVTSTASLTPGEVGIDVLASIRYQEFLRDITPVMQLVVMDSSDEYAKRNMRLDPSRDEQPLILGGFVPDDQNGYYFVTSKGFGYIKNNGETNQIGGLSGESFGQAVKKVLDTATTLKVQNPITTSANSAIGAIMS